MHLAKHLNKLQENTWPASFTPNTIFLDHKLPLRVVGVVKAISSYNNMSHPDLKMLDGNSAVKIDGGRG